MTNPFAAAIDVLKTAKSVAERAEISGRMFGDVLLQAKYYPEFWNGCEAAIRVLEAAGRVDKEVAIDAYHFGKTCFELYDLLAFLPDEKEKP